MWTVSGIYQAFILLSTIQELENTFFLNTNGLSVLLNACETWKQTSTVFVNNCLRLSLKVRWRNTIINLELWKITRCVLLYMKNFNRILDCIRTCYVIIFRPVQNRILNNFNGFCQSMNWLLFFNVISEERCSEKVWTDFHSRDVQNCARKLSCRNVCVAPDGT